MIRSFLMSPLLIVFAFTLCGSPLIAATVEEGFAAHEAGDYRRAFGIYLPLANQGDVNAQFNLGVMYRQGQGVAQDYRKSIIWYRRAAEQGDTEAQNALGTLYEYGEGVPIDYYEAFQWYKLAADSGDAFAQYKLASLYAKGRGVSKDHERAITLLGQSARNEYAPAVKPLHWFAEHGYANAQYNLAALYDSGEAVKGNDQLAASWSQKAAAQGHADAQALLGRLYLAGKGVRKNRQEAENWFLKSMLQSKLINLDVIVCLTDLYLTDGDGVSSDSIKVYVWAELGNRHMEGYKDLFAYIWDFTEVGLEIFMMKGLAVKQMTKAQLAQAKSLVDRWYRLFEQGLPKVSVEHLRSLTPP